MRLRNLLTGSLWGVLALLLVPRFASGVRSTTEDKLGALLNAGCLNSSVDTTPRTKPRPSTSEELESFGDCCETYAGDPWCSRDENWFYLCAQMILECPRR